HAREFVFSSVCIGGEFSENAADQAIDSAAKPIHPGVINRVLTIRAGLAWQASEMQGAQPRSCAPSDRRPEIAGSEDVEADGHAQHRLEVRCRLGRTNLEIEVQSDAIRYRIAPADQEFADIERIALDRLRGDTPARNFLPGLHHVIEGKAKADRR